MTMINETNHRMQLIDDETNRRMQLVDNETNRRTQILIKQQMRQLVDDETNKRSELVNNTLHTNEILLQNHQMVTAIQNHQIVIENDFQIDYRNKILKFLIIIGCIVFIVAILIIIIQCIRRFKCVNSKELAEETMKKTFESKTCMRPEQKWKRIAIMTEGKV
eukprot:375477_1